MAEPLLETIPATLTVERPAVSLGRQTYDMTVNVGAGRGVQGDILGRIPPAVLEAVVAYPAPPRLTLAIDEV